MVFTLWWSLGLMTRLQGRTAAKEYEAIQKDQEHLVQMLFACVPIRTRKHTVSISPCVGANQCKKTMC